jgi:gamma-glutamylcyclotransferase (GGCT)/AIG2-like uncharacterized protein YtfP
VDDAPQHLFVYGTLLPGRAPAAVRELTAELKPVGPGSSATPVSGQVFELPGNAVLLQRLDEYEGCDWEHPERSLFVRVQRRITLADGSTLLCWVFLYNRDVSAARLIPGGDYAAWLAGRRGSST